MMIHFFPSVGVKSYGAVHHHFKSWFRERLHSDEPLIRQVWLDHCVAPVAASDVVGIGFNFVEESLFLQICHDEFPCLESVETTVSFRDIVVQPGRYIKDVDLRKIVTLADPVVVRVMGGRHLHHARAKGRINKLVGNNRDFSSCEGKGDHLADQMRIPFILRIDGNCGITQHGFRPGRGNHDNIIR